MARGLYHDSTPLVLAVSDLGMPGIICYAVVGLAQPIPCVGLEVLVPLWRHVSPQSRWQWVHDQMAGE
jgi:cell division inhibitor SulA